MCRHYRPQSDTAGCCSSCSHASTWRLVVPHHAALHFPLDQPVVGVVEILELPGVDGMRGTELLGPLQLLVEHVDSDDLRSADKRRRLNRIQADSATTEHHDCRTWPDLRSVHD